MASQPSTAFSDLMLAGSAFYTAYIIYPQCLLFAIGIFLEGLAASAGVLRFGIPAPGSTLVGIHKFLTLMTTVLGLAAMSASAHIHEGYENLAFIILISAVMVFLADMLRLLGNQRQLFIGAVSGFSLLNLVFVSFINGNLYRGIGGVMYIIAGSVIGSVGYIFGIPRVDLLHYVLFGANILLLRSWVSNV